MKRIRALWVLVLAALLAAPLPAAAAPGTEREVQLGRTYSRQLESHYKVVTDKAIVERVARIGAEVAAVSDRPELPYTFKVIDLPVPTALSLPGGFIYVAKDFLLMLRSDHELAAVLAHETGHAAHRHQIENIDRGTRVDILTLLTALLTRDPRLAQGVQLVGYSVLSGYTREQERNADLTAIEYLVKTQYTPVGMLTVMERLLREERLSAGPDPGAFRQHPRTAERVAYLEEDLRRRGIPLIRRIAANYLRITLQTVSDQGRQIGELFVNETLVLRLPDPDRLRAAAGRLDRFFNTDPQPFEVTSRPVEGGVGIFAGSALLVAITPSDAAFLGSAPADAAISIQARLRWAIEEDIRKRRFNG